MESISLPLAFLINWGWLQIGPYLHLNINPVLFSVGPLTLHWYGLMYVVAIVMGRWLIRRSIARQGIKEAQIYRMLWWCVVAGLVGGRLYFVIQQPDLVPNYLLKPQHILATWEGGMAFYGAVFLIVPVLFWRAVKERLNLLLVLDAGALFAAVAQPSMFLTLSSVLVAFGAGLLSFLSPCVLPLVPAFFRTLPARSSFS